MKLSQHSKVRMAERANVTRDQKSFFRNALKYGKNANDFKDGQIKYFLLHLERRNCQVKLYRGYVFLHSKNSKQLYTMYKLPDELLKKEGE